MINFALKMKDFSWVDYICFCLENRLKPCEVKNLKIYSKKLNLSKNWEV